jgi:aspartyl-tRNA(Asn)/glutamyl-tRNA(Gln) amidotransferase subunit C
MAITRQEVDHVAHLSRLALTEAEKDLFVEQLTAIVSYMDKLNELDTADVEPMLHGIAGDQRLRIDEVAGSLPREDALQNAPAQGEGCFKVPRIIQ